MFSPKNKDVSVYFGIEFWEALHMDHMTPFINYKCQNALCFEELWQRLLHVNGSILKEYFSIFLRRVLPAYLQHDYHVITMHKNLHFFLPERRAEAALLTSALLLWKGLLIEGQLLNCVTINQIQNNSYSKM